MIMVLYSLEAASSKALVNQENRSLEISQIVKTNIQEIDLNHSRGFKETGETIDDEIVLARNLKEWWYE